MRPYIVGIGGTLRAGSTTERLLLRALAIGAGEGAETDAFGAADLDLPNYAPDRETPPAARRMLACVARANAVIVASPGYHGAMSGMIKNALDYLEGLRNHNPPYLEGRAVGSIAVASGWQAAVTTLVSIRGTIHALRGWPSPLGVAVNSSGGVFGEDGSIKEPKIEEQLTTMVRDLLAFCLEPPRAR